MKVLLIWPNNPEAVLSNELSLCEPLSLEYVAGALKGFHNVKIWDLRLDKPLAKLAEEYEPDVVGLALPFTTILRFGKDTAKEVKRLWPSCFLILGGHHPSVSESWMDGFQADYVIKGEGGSTFLNLINDIEKNGEKQRPKKTIILDAPKVTDYDMISKPDRSLLKHHKNSYFHSIYNPVSLIRFSIGCPFSCSFCILWKLTDRKYIVKQFDRIIEELNEIDVENIYVVDDEAFINPVRMGELANEIRLAGIKKKYHMYLRADTAVRNPQIIENWANLGLDSVLVGAESFSEHELIDYNKKAMVNDTEKAVKIFHDNNIKVRANFIVRPDFEEDDFKRLEETVYKLGIDLPSFAVLTPLPGTDLHTKTKDELIVDNSDLYDCYHTLFKTRLPLERFYELFASLISNSSNRNKKDAKADAPMFYFSSDNYFEEMINKIRNSHKLYT